jgi:MFS family permease
MALLYCCIHCLDLGWYVNANDNTVYRITANLTTAFDFFTVSLTVSDLAKEFGKTTKDITWGITLVLMFRSVGSIAFGIAADRYGRKWPFVVNNILFIILELGTGFCQTYNQFLAVRALFGVAMGGLYGNAAGKSHQLACIFASLTICSHCT